MSFGADPVTGVLGGLSGFGGKIGGESAAAGGSSGNNSITFGDFGGANTQLLTFAVVGLLGWVIYRELAR